MKEKRDKVQSGLALEIHPRKVQKDRKSKHKEKGHIWVSKTSPLLAAYCMPTPLCLEIAGR